MLAVRCPGHTGAEPDKEIVKMADEEKQEKQQTAQSGQEQASGAEKKSQAAKETGGEETQQYKDLQAKYDAEQKARVEAEQTLEAVQPYIDWGAAEKGHTEASSPEGDEDGADGSVSKKELDARDRRIQGQLLTLQFRADYPDLREYEDRLVGPAIARLRHHHPTWNREKLVKEAAKETREFLSKERETAKKEAEAEAEKKRKEAAGAGGFGSARATTPKKEDQGQSSQEYFGERQAKLAKMKGQT